MVRCGLALIVQSVLVWLPAKSVFTPDFNQYLKNNFGAKIQRRLSRSELGPDASFGGKSHAAEQLTRHPVIIVHGLGNTAQRFKGTADHFAARGYKRSELYATTWGDGGRTPFGLVDMRCAYVKQVRNMIISVRLYTKKNVDVISYSMGAPIARKAILGGLCVDTKENLGASITQMVDTFVSVAGANFGSSLCFFPIPVGSCNTRTGLHCKSKFLKDINSRRSYEAKFIYTVYSTSDDKVGYKNCGRTVGNIQGQTKSFRKSGLNHDQLMDSTRELQRTLVLNHTP